GSWHPQIERRKWPQRETQEQAVLSVSWWAAYTAMLTVSTITCLACPLKTERTDKCRNIAIALISHPLSAAPPAPAFDTPRTPPQTSSPTPHPPCESSARQSALRNRSAPSTPP